MALAEAILKANPASENAPSENEVRLAYGIRALAEGRRAPTTGMYRGAVKVLYELAKVANPQQHGTPDLIRLAQVNEDYQGAVDSILSALRGASEARRAPCGACGRRQEAVDEALRHLSAVPTLWSLSVVKTNAMNATAALRRVAAPVAPPGAVPCGGRWLIYFQDPACKPILFTGANAEATARKAFTGRRMAWSCFLLREVEAADLGWQPPPPCFGCTGRFVSERRVGDTTYRELFLCAKCAPPGAGDVPQHERT